MTEKKEKKDTADEDERSPEFNSRGAPRTNCYLCVELKKASDRRHWTQDYPRVIQVKELMKDGTIACYSAVEDDELGAIVLQTSPQTTQNQRGVLYIVVYMI